MKLLIITQTVNTEDPVLGFFVRWIEEFAKHAETVEVICLKEGSHAFLPSNVRVYSLGKKRGAPRSARRATYAFRFLTLVWRLRHRYDAVFVHMNPEYLVLAGWLWRLLKKRSVLWYTHKSVNLRLRLAVYFADAVCTASAESFRLPSEKVYVVGHGIDTVAFVPERRARRGKMLHVLTIGRLSPTKRIAEMLAALDELAARKVSFSFTIAGVPATLVDEHYEKSIRDALIKKSYAKQVRFLGAVSHKEIPKLLATHDVFVNLSLTGSIDKAVLEALTSGVPVVTTNEAFRSLLAPVGLYVEGGTPQTIADALMRAAKLDIRALAAEVREHYALPHAIAKVFGILDL